MRLLNENLFFHTYICIIFIGERISLCQANRSWSHAPLCQPLDCGQPPVIANAIVNITSTTYPSSLEYKCMLGYDYHGK